MRAETDKRLLGGMENRMSRTSRRDSFSEHNQLGQEMLGRNQPITADDLWRFRQNPGFCVSDACLSSKRVGSIEDLMLGPSNQPAYIERDGVPILVVGSSRRLIHPSELIGIPEESTLAYCDLVGFVGGASLLLVRVAAAEKNYLILGYESIWCDSYRSHVTILDDSTIVLQRSSHDGTSGLVIQRRSPKGEWSNIGHVPGHLVGGLLDSDGKVYVYFRTERSVFVQWLGHGPLLSPAMGRPKLTELINTRSGLRAIGEWYGQTLCELVPRYETAIASHELRELPDQPSWLKGPEYDHGYTELDDGRIAYVGQMRHNQVAWVVDGVACEAVDTVTALFKDETSGRYRYWALIGSNLALFEIPSKE